MNPICLALARAGVVRVGGEARRATIFISRSRWCSWSRPWSPTRASDICSTLISTWRRFPSATSGRFSARSTLPRVCSKKECVWPPDLFDAALKLPLLVSEGLSMMEERTRRKPQRPLTGVRATLYGGACLVAGAILIGLDGPWPVAADPAHDRDCCCRCGAAINRQFLVFSFCSPPPTPFYGRVGRNSKLKIQNSKLLLPQFRHILPQDCPVLTSRTHQLAPDK